MFLGLNYFYGKLSLFNYLMYKKDKNVSRINTPRTIVRWEMIHNNHLLWTLFQQLDLQLFNNKSNGLGMSSITSPFSGHRNCY